MQSVPITVSNNNKMEVVQRFISKLFYNLCARFLSHRRCHTQHAYIKLHEQIFKLE